MSNIETMQLGSVLIKGVLKECKSIREMNYCTRGTGRVRYTAGYSAGLSERITRHSLINFNKKNESVVMVITICFFPHVGFQLNQEKR